MLQFWPPDHRNSPSAQAMFTKRRCNLCVFQYTPRSSWDADVVIYNSVSLGPLPISSYAAQIKEGL